MPPTLAVDAVVAIDFGTSSTGYAWANAGQPSAVTCKVTAAARGQPSPRCVRQLPLTDALARRLRV
jgi:hypothetical protein